MNLVEYKEPILIKNKISDWGIPHWNKDYILDIDGDTECLCYIGKDKATYKDFFENYNLYGFNTSLISPNITTNFIKDIIFPYKSKHLLIGNLIYGDGGTGALPHLDPATTNILISGKKRWTIFPVHDSHLDGLGNKVQEEYYEYIKMDTKDYNIKDLSNTWPSNYKEARIQYHGYPEHKWFNTQYSSLLKRYKKKGLPIIEFVQEAGDMTYVPGGWCHHTVNLEKCFALVNVVGR